MSDFLVRCIWGELLHVMYSLKMSVCDIFLQIWSKFVQHMIKNSVFVIASNGKRGVKKSIKFFSENRQFPGSTAPESR